MSMVDPILDSHNWAAIPFEFWSAVFFVFGCVVGSFLNVCIHRLPLGESIVSPPSHCPHCRYSIPWYLNIPLVTWVFLGGKCRNCGAPIAVRYFLVELLTGLLFFGCWVAFGHQSVGLALICSLFLAGLVVATFIDFEHFIIPDEITIGGMVAGCVASVLVPAIQQQSSLIAALKASLFGMAVGAAIIYIILRGGKLVFGREKLKLTGETRIVFGETALHLPDRQVLYGDIFYRESDTVRFHARTLELVDRCYKDVQVCLSRGKLQVDDEVLDPEKVPHMEAIISEIVLPREAMGLGDVKFMAAIGAFLGWHAVVFSLVVSSLIGSLVGVTLVLVGRRALSSRLPYGPYIAMAAALWVFAGPDLVQWYQQVLLGVMGRR
jgi:leader peptidase (prepilin peptidase) / N-methyltransferase